MHGVRGGDVLDVGGRDFQQRLRVLSCRCLVAARERDVIELQMQCGLYRVRRECVHEVRLGDIQEQCGRRRMPIMWDRLDIATVAGSDVEYVPAPHSMHPDDPVCSL